MFTVHNHRPLLMAFTPLRVRFWPGHAAQRRVREHHCSVVDTNVFVHIAIISLATLYRSCRRLVLLVRDDGPMKFAHLRYKLVFSSNRKRTSEYTADVCHLPCKSLHCALSLAAQCIVIGPVCGFVCLWVCYHDNSKLRASIFTKLGL